MEYVWSTGLDRLGAVAAEDRRVVGGERPVGEADLDGCGGGRFGHGRASLWPSRVTRPLAEEAETDIPETPDQRRVRPEVPAAQLDRHRQTEPAGNGRRGRLQALAVHRPPGG